jgi:GNAT superfamily N-acetyltransferase
MVTAHVELVDNWHARWPAVLESIAEHGDLEALNIDSDGWLSARQVLLVAFSRDGEVAGHLCFRLTPDADADGRIGIDAHLETFGVRPGSQAEKIASALKSAAVLRARKLRCRRIVGFSE